MADLTCIRCEKQLENILEGGPHQPVNGLAFSTPGHYGSTYFDPMNGSYLELSICDDCVRWAHERGLTHSYNGKK